MDKENVTRLVNLYMERSHLSECQYAAEQTGKGLDAVNKEIGANERAILAILPKLKAILDDPKRFMDFLDFLKKMIEKDTERFQISFAEPYLDEFINILLFDIKRKKIADEKTLGRWKEQFSRNGIEINF